MKIIILILVAQINVSYAFFGFGEKKEIDPREIKDHEQRIEWLKKHNPQIFQQIKNGERTFPKENEQLWLNYLELTKKPLDLNEEKRKREQNIKELKAAQLIKNKEIEEKIKKGYKMVNGELIDLEQQRKNEANEKVKKKEMQRVLDFYKEMEMELPENPNSIKLKED